MNAFRCTPDRSLDREYLRTCAIYRLLKSKRIGQAEANRLQNHRWRGYAWAKPRRDYLTATIELWRANSLKDMLP